MKLIDYTGDRQTAISFPLGGLGTGCIGLGGDGRFIDWEIANHPSKGSLNGYSHVALRCEEEGRTVDLRIVQGDLRTGYAGVGHGRFAGFGFGPDRRLLAGMPHFSGTIFRAAYPFAEVGFTDPGCPCEVRLTAFNPFIPHNDRDSGLPGAFLCYEVTNRSGRPLAVTLAATLGNPLPGPQLHEHSTGTPLKWLHLATRGVPADDPAWCELTLMTDAGRVSVQDYGFRGRWFDDLEIMMRDLGTPGPLRQRTYPLDKAGVGNHGTLAAHFDLAPGASQRVRFLIAWNFPTRENDWDPSAGEAADAAGLPRRWKNWYATAWPGGSRESAAYAFKHWDRLESATRRFQEALFSSTLPDCVLDAVSANLSILKSPTVMRLEDGTFYGFEGCHSTSGSCEGSCTHVWNYAQALPFLFPRLARSMREADYAYNLTSTGGMPFRLRLPLGLKANEQGRSCADGLFGNVLVTYRDWKLSGDTAWLRKLWPAIKRAIAYAWHPGNTDRWDPERRGVLTGRQHHTLDMELFGPNSWLTGFYLGALQAAAEMARHLGEPELADEYEAIAARGREWLEANLFNGEYYFHLIDLNDRTPVDAHNVADTYWNEEHGEVKYQIGEGCGIDQILAQYHADLYGLGDIFQPDRVRSALEAIFRHNFISPLRNLVNPCRIYGLNDESGLIICSWPAGRRRPAIPVPYAQEAMHGFEYAAAALMISRGLLDEGLSVVAGIRERYDGRMRNPWNEIECGSNYARSMASYALIPILSGFTFDMTEGRIGFAPLPGMPTPFCTFWSVGEAWGLLELDAVSARLQVLGGTLPLRRLDLPGVTDDAAARLGGQPVALEADADGLCFASPLEMTADAETALLEIDL